MVNSEATAPRTEEVSRRRVLAGLSGWIFTISSVLGITWSIVYVFGLRVFGFQPDTWVYMLALIGLFMPLVFLIFPARKGVPTAKARWYDYLAALLVLVISIYFATQEAKIVSQGWATGITTPIEAKIAGLIIVLLALEGARRVAGPVYTGICVVAVVVPLISSHLPGFLQGTQFRFWGTISQLVMGPDGLLGVPMRMFGTLMVGFMVFGVVMQGTGGGRFFINLAYSLLGHTRGGPAKIAVVASMLFGSLSGSSAANVVATGSMTIPAMKKVGFKPAFAGAVEACASTGGVIMPPVMGAVAFLISEFLGLPYSYIIVAAFVPSVLYYLSLYVQIDGYSVRHGLKGLPRETLPSLKRTLKEGWFYVTAFALLIYLLVYAHLEARAPFYATALLLVLTFLRKDTRLNLRSFFNLVIDSGKILAELVGILAAIGFLIGALTMTGVAASFSGEISRLAGNDLFALLLMGFGVSFILGMGVTTTAVYIFTVLMFAPVLINLGLNPLAVHLFVVYSGNLSHITPPVALAAYVAAGIAGSSPLKTGFESIRLGGCIYIIPFIFVLNPALIFSGSPLQILFSFIITALAIVFIASALVGYLMGVGILTWKSRILTAAAGVLFASLSVWGVGYIP